MQNYNSRQHIDDKKCIIIIIIVDQLTKTRNKYKICDFPDHNQQLRTTTWQLKKNILMIIVSNVLAQD